MRLAPWWQRAAAATIDSALLLLVSSLLLLVLAKHPLWTSSHGERAIRYASAFTAALLYYPPLMRVTNGMTLGKLALRIRVVRTDRHPMTVARAAWREAVVKVALFDAILVVPAGRAIGTLAIALNYLWPLWDAENRALHDMLAGTRVRVAGSREPRSSE